LSDAKELIEQQRPVADFADVYVKSVEKFMREYKVASKPIRQ
jgi:hypothetical protein